MLDIMRQEYTRVKKCVERIQQKSTDHFEEAKKRCKLNEMKNI